MKVCNKHIIVFDGACMLCSRWVHFIVNRDTKNQFAFSAMQTPFGTHLLEENNISASDPSTFLLVKNGKIFTSSDAIFEVLSEFNAPWKYLSALNAIPKAWRDELYFFAARNRYRWFGKKKVCLIPKDCNPDKFIFS